ncbi:lipopolysaccharide-induced tumor necrosis factor-alpha factor homolog isoform X2 [Esox lucius]|uniref:LITAF domain-containing protein n=1 Tax=Esox lucius TaxID=8010 RepID=A0A6Q2XI19_ESOLU|nr:lipopolysaccharide-induced tumor necrosis factor-alpha factor homolog isoform X2 [Esox lucius]
MQVQMQNQQMYYPGGNNMAVQPVQFANAPSAPQLVVAQPVQYANPAPQLVVAQPVQYANPAPQLVNAQPVQYANPAMPTNVMGRPKAMPGRMRCPYCQTDIVTETTYVYGTLTWTIIITLGVCMIWPFCLIPFCCKECEDVEHHCPNCNRMTHVHKRM